MIRDSRSNTCTYLKNVPLFRGLDEKELDALYHAGSIKTFQSGNFILFQNDPGETFYVIPIRLCKNITPE
ncbi:MAG: cyclic nucleotide-binding domain-containing protein [Candidatus Loosdrechtia sp.]|uniref:cyclic nucleotide-binding domain-containing protein n=1 Tax=Candidatus Loosdrechtia sp. TaxID=3101272 RepID=UPI003A74E2CB|nr:MAG: cyclic nucleotide-binding domain-containing protein [Candidatus Jettenia sp. AMX2]